MLWKPCQQREQRKCKWKLITMITLIPSKKEFLVFSEHYTGCLQLQFRFNIHQVVHLVNGNNLKSNSNTSTNMHSHKIGYYTHINSFSTMNLSILQDISFLWNIMQSLEPEHMSVLIYIAVILVLYKGVMKDPPICSVLAQQWNCPSDLTELGQSTACEMNVNTTEK
jgi:hypothetical protein